MANNWGNAGSIIASLRKTSGLFSLLVLDVILALLISISLLGPEEITFALIGLTSLSVIATIIAYFILMYKDPNMLRSEIHVRQMRALDLLGDNLHGTRVAPADIVAIANPDHPMRNDDVIELPENAERQDSDRDPPQLA
jgi:hypothetical protein